MTKPLWERLAAGRTSLDNYLCGRPAEPLCRACAPVRACSPIPNAPHSAGREARSRIDCPGQQLVGCKVIDHRRCGLADRRVTRAAGPLIAAGVFGRVDFHVQHAIVRQRSGDAPP